MSGGNQQKVSIAKWVYENHKVIIFDEPTRGVDVELRQKYTELCKILLLREWDYYDFFGTAGNYRNERQSACNERGKNYRGTPASRTGGTGNYALCVLIWKKEKRRRSMQKKVFKATNQVGGALIGLIVLVIVFSILSPSFLQPIML